jgi:putative transposase
VVSEVRWDGKLLCPGGVGAVAAESLLLKHQLLISNRSRKRAPNLTTLDRFVLGLTTLFVNPRRVAKLGALVKPATLFKFHRALVDRKYRLLFSSSPHPCKHGPKGPSPELIAAIVDMKRRNPCFGCRRIAQQIAHAFGIESTRMSSAASSPNTTGQSQERMARPG